MHRRLHWLLRDVAELDLRDEKRLEKLETMLELAASQHVGEHSLRQTSLDTEDAMISSIDAKRAASRVSGVAAVYANGMVSCAPGDRIFLDPAEYIRELKSRNPGWDDLVKHDSVRRALSRAWEAARMGITVSQDEQEDIEAISSLMRTVKLNCREEPYAETAYGKCSYVAMGVKRIADAVYIQDGDHCFVAYDPKTMELRRLRRDRVFGLEKIQSDSDLRLSISSDAVVRFLVAEHAVTLLRNASIAADFCNRMKISERWVTIEAERRKRAGSKLAKIKIPSIAGDDP